MTTPFSVFTNLAYIIAGLYVLRGQGHIDVWHHWITERVLYETKSYTRSLSSWLVGLSLVALGVTSGLYHGFYSPWAQLADERGMYLVFGVLAGVVWARTPMLGILAWHGLVPERLRGQAQNAVRWFGLALGLVLAAFAVEPWVDSSYVMPALAILCILGIGVGQSWARALRFFVGFLAIAATREIGEPAGLFGYDPLFNYDPIHGGWHLFTAFYLWKMWKSTYTPPTDGEKP